MPRTPSAPTCLAFDTGALLLPLLAVGHDSGGVSLYSVTEPSTVRTYCAPHAEAKRATAVCVSSTVSAVVIAAGHSDGSVTVWTVESDGLEEARVPHRPSYDPHRRVFTTLEAEKMAAMRRHAALGAPPNPTVVQSSSRAAASGSGSAVASVEALDLGRLLIASADGLAYVLEKGENTTAWSPSKVLDVNNPPHHHAQRTSGGAAADDGAQDEKTASMVQRGVHAEAEAERVRDSKRASPAVLALHRHKEDDAFAETASTSRDWDSVFSDAQAFERTLAAGGDHDDVLGTVVRRLAPRAKVGRRWRTSASPLGIPAGSQSRAGLVRNRTLRAATGGKNIPTLSLVRPVDLSKMPKSRLATIVRLRHMGL